MTHTIGIALPEQYETLFQKKALLTKDEFSEFTPPELQVFPSPPSHFRMRAEFKVWHEDGIAYYAMYKPGEYKKPFKIQEYSFGSTTINQLMTPLMAFVNKSEQLKRKLFQIEFLTSTTGDCLTTLIYHKPLDESWTTEAKTLEEKLNTKIIGRSRGQKLALSDDFITEQFTVNGKTFIYQQVETGFTQPNAAVCASMLNWASAVSQSIGGDLLELYCGNGNFTLALAENFNQVLATEVSKTSVASALYNIKLNENNNIDVLRMSSEEFTQAMEGVREFRRMKDIDLHSYQFSTIFVDPPRSGLDEKTEKLVTRFDNILYISCNPETLKQNLRHICQSHEIKEFAFFDQFPYTDHRECGVLLTRKTVTV